MIKNRLSFTCSSSEQRVLLASTTTSIRTTKCDNSTLNKFQGNCRQRNSGTCAATPSDLAVQSNRTQSLQTNTPAKSNSTSANEINSLSQADPSTADTADENIATSQVASATTRLPSDQASNAMAPKKSGTSANAINSSPTATTSELEEDIQRFTDLVNNFRAQNGLPGLRTDTRVQQLAMQHSQDQASVGQMSHNGFESRGNNARQAISGAKMAAENVAYNQGASDPVSTAFNGLVNSPGHRANMLRNYPTGVTGVGIVRSASGAYYFTQLFVG